MRTDRQTDRVKPIYPPQTLFAGGYKYKSLQTEGCSTMEVNNGKTSHDHSVTIVLQLQKNVEIFSYVTSVNSCFFPSFILKKCFSSQICHNKLISSSTDYFFYAKMELRKGFIIIVFQYFQHLDLHT